MYAQRIFLIMSEISLIFLAYFTQGQPSQRLMDWGFLYWPVYLSSLEQSVGLLADRQLDVGWGSDYYTELDLVGDALDFLFSV